MIMAKIQGVVLAGGQSRRFGSPKAFAKRDGIPFYRYSIEALKPFSSSIVIVTNTELHRNFKEVESNAITIINDTTEYQGQGPLAGIYTAMQFQKADWYMVTPIDVPFIESVIFQQLVPYTNSNVDAIIPIVAEKKQPLLALYRYRLKEDIQQMLTNGKRSVHRLLENKRVMYIPLHSEHSFININRKSDYVKYVHHPIQNFYQEEFL